MKVVIFCGGLGVRMGEETQGDPEADDHRRQPADPLAHHEVVRRVGAHEFVLCLGYKGECIKQYFLDYNEALSNDFVLSNGGRDVELLGSDISDWRITFVDTGAQSTIAERLLAVAPHLGDDEYFLATYGDGLTDAPLPDMIERLESSGKSGLFLSVRPMFNAHVVDADATAPSARSRTSSRRTSGSTAASSSSDANVLDYINPGEELVVEPFRAADRGVAS